MANEVASFKKDERLMAMPAFKFKTYAECTSYPDNLVLKLSDNIFFLARWVIYHGWQNCTQQPHAPHLF